MQIKNLALSVLLVATAGIANGANDEITVLISCPKNSSQSSPNEHTVSHITSLEDIKKLPVRSIFF